METGIHLPSADVINQKLMEKGINLEERLNDTPTETPDTPAPVETQEYEWDENEERKPVAKEKSTEEKSGDPDEEGKADVNAEAKTLAEELELDDGGDNMPIPERKKHLLKDYHKKMKVISDTRKELDTYRDQLQQAAEQVQQLYAYVQQQAQMQQMVQSQQPIAPQQDTDAAKQERIAKIIQSMGLQVDEFTDKNVILLATKMDEMQNMNREQLRKVEQAQHEALVTSEAKRLKNEYEELSKKYGLSGPKDEGAVLSIMQNQQAYNRAFSVEDAIKYYVDSAGFNDEERLIERLKATGKLDGLKAKLLSEMKAQRKEEAPPIPSGAGGSVVGSTQQRGSQKFATLQEAAAAAIADLRAGRIRTSKRR